MLAELTSAVNLHQQGRLPEAARLYQAILRSRRATPRPCICSASWPSSPATLRGRSL